MKFKDGESSRYVKPKDLRVGMRVLRFSGSLRGGHHYLPIANVTWKAKLRKYYIRVEVPTAERHTMPAHFYVGAATQLEVLNEEDA